MATVQETVKEKLVGFSTETPVPSETRSAFMKNALTDDNGDYYLDESRFVDVIAPPTEDYRKIQRAQYALLFRVADRRRTGRITLSDWAYFENLLHKPDAEYQIAFRLFDTKGDGVIKFDDFKKLYDANKSPTSLPFDWNSEWASLYTGGRKKRHDLTYHQFSQLLRGLQGERVRQAFQHFDQNGDGYIEPEEFQRIIEGTAKHKLSDHIIENLHTLINATGGSRISYATVRAFQNVIQSMEQVEQIVRTAARQSPDGTITREEFLNVSARSRRFSNFTPMETDILFHFAGMDSPSGRLTLSAFAKVLDSSWITSDRFEAVASETTAISSSRNILRSILESGHHFALGSIAGAFGAFMVYPIDLVKTRMQNQRGNVGNLLYKNSFDCASKVLRNEGVRGFYSGVLPQMVGVAPEKAIKLTVNDLVRGKAMDKESGTIWLPHEILAGGMAGGCQVIFTNPLEIVKIRLQVQGELIKSGTGAPKRSALWIVRNLGLKGLYKGATACLARDIPFSAIYFPAYAHLKSGLFGESPTKKLGVLQLLTAGAIAGMPAAYLTTPFDVIKTRLQVEARKGDQIYNSLRHAARTIYAQEGFKAFFKGGPARILRSSPQFGFTLAGYEVLQNLLPLPGQSEDTTAPAPLAESKAPLPYLRSRNALKILMDLDEGFGVPKMSKGSNWINPLAPRD